MNDDFKRRACDAQSNAMNQLGSIALTVSDTRETVAILCTALDGSPDRLDIDLAVLACDALSMLKSHLNLPGSLPANDDDVRAFLNAHNA